MNPNPLSIRSRAIVPVGITPSPPVPNPQGYPKGTEPVAGACENTCRRDARPAKSCTSSDELEIRVSLGSSTPEVKNGRTFSGNPAALDLPRLLFVILLIFLVQVVVFVVGEVVVFVFL